MKLLRSPSASSASSAAAATRNRRRRRWQGFLAVMIGLIVVKFVLPTENYDHVALVFSDTTTMTTTTTMKNLLSTTTTAAVKQSQHLQERLADGCYHVYLDVGANIGIHTRFLFEPHHYPLAKNAHKAFREGYGEDRHPKDVCSFGFEPNPTHAKRQKELEAAYQAMGWRYTPMLVGVGDQDGNLTFYEDGRDADRNSWGYSVVRRRPGVKAEVVPIIHLSKWIEHHILNRRLPDVVHGPSSRPPSVVMKLDIEGMEFIVGPSLIFSGVLCQAIDVIFGEYHDAGQIPKRDAMDELGRGELPKFKDWREARDQFNAMWKALKTVNPSDCKTRYLDLFDDEPYLHDGVPFPVPP